MVSTRQMATSSSAAAAISSNGGSGSGGNDETTRLSVVTRQSSSNSNNMGANCSTSAAAAAAAAFTSPTTTAATSTTVAANTAAAAAAATATATTTHVSTVAVTTRHSHLTQAVKTQCAGSTATTAAAATTSTVTTTIITTGSGSGSSIRQVHLLDLPLELLSKIFSYEDFKRIGQLRVVSPKVNDVCMHILNSTFSKLITQTYNHFHAIKASMPRRESARRNHPLACECDIIETCYMRLSLLQMTIGKHIERGHCCFFPGAILDEVYIILNYIKNTPCLERPYRVTDELFDLSTMAMEYFRDRIEPTLPGIAYFNKDFFKLPTTTKRPLVIASDLSDSSTSLPSPPQSNMVLRKGIRKIKQGMKIYNNQLSVLRNELRTCKRKSVEQGKQIAEQQKLLAEQQKQTLEYANRMDENDKKNEEMARKFSTLLQELNKCKTELQYWRSKSPAMPACTSCGQKVVPVLPPEDYQALINQGVKPEDIILNLNDETDAESDASLSESNLTLSNEFVFPDETTTAKLLAVNTAAAKNLKRQHHHSHFVVPHATTATATAATAAAITAATASNSITNTSSNVNIHEHLSGNEMQLQQQQQQQQLYVRNDAHAICDGPTEMTQCLVYAKGEQIIKSNCTLLHHQQHNHAAAAAATAATTISPVATASTTQPQYINDKDLNVSNTPGENVNASTNTNTNANGNNNDNGSSGGSGGGGGYATKLFYGTNVHKSVIVSPSRMSENTIIEQRNAAGTAAAAEQLNVIASDDGGGGSGNGSVVDGVAGVGEDVVALYAIKSHETKKARRVQKATRCASASGSKRSK